MISLLFSFKISDSVNDRFSFLKIRIILTSAIFEGKTIEVSYSQDLHRTNFLPRITIFLSVSVYIRISQTPIVSNDICFGTEF